MNKEQRKILERAFDFILESANEEEAQKIIDALRDLSKKESNIRKNMTGKEALLDLIDTIKYTHNDGKTLLPYDKEITDAIMADLETLRIIKEHYHFSVVQKCFDGYYHYYLCLYMNRTEYCSEITYQEYLTLKEQLKRWELK